MNEVSEDRVYARHDRRRGAVLIVGTGAVGGFLAEELARVGYSLVLVDKDVLEQENLVRHPLGAEWLGQSKAPSLAAKIKRDLPVCDARGVDADFMALPESEQLALVRGADIVVAATDMFECQCCVNRVCLSAEIDAVFPGIWVDPRVRDGEVSEILWVLPGRHTPCFECAVAFRHGHPDAQAGRGNRLDMQQLAIATAQIVIALMDPTDVRGALLDPQQTAIYIHGFTPRSPGVRDTFPTEGLRNQYAHVPFPPTPCPACGGWDPPQPSPTPATSTGLGTHPRVPATPTPPPTHAGAWAMAALVAIALVIIGVVALRHGHSPPASAASRPHTTKAPAAPLPQTASTSFNLTPSFQASSTTVSGSVTDPISQVTDIHMSLTPALRGFELVIGVSAQYTAAGINMVGSTGQIPNDVSGNCMAISAQGTSYHEFPMETNLTVSGTSVTGDVVYAAVMPGVYSFGIDGCGGVTLGTVTTPNLGNSFGSDLGNGLAVFAERTSKTDTVLLFGAIGDDGDPQSSVSTSCIVGNNAVQADDPTWKPSSYQVVQQKTESGVNGVWYDLGTMTFNQPANQVSGASYNYTCQPNANAGVALHS